MTLCECRSRFAAASPGRGLPGRRWKKLKGPPEKTPADCTPVAAERTNVATSASSIMPLRLASLPMLRMHEGSATCPMFDGCGTLAPETSIGWRHNRAATIHWFFINTFMAEQVNGDRGFALRAKSQDAAANVVSDA